MADRFKSRAALVGKIEWEGGLIDALDYGIRASEMPLGDTELIEAWKALEDAWDVVKPLAERVEDLLDDTPEDEEPLHNPGRARLELQALLLDNGAQIRDCPE